MPLLELLNVGSSTRFTDGMPGVLLAPGFGAAALLTAFIGTQPLVELFAEVMCVFVPAGGELVFDGELQPLIANIPKIKIIDRISI